MNERLLYKLIGVSALSFAAISYTIALKSHQQRMQGISTPAPLFQHSPQVSHQEELLYEALPEEEVVTEDAIQHIIVAEQQEEHPDAQLAPPRYIQNAELPPILKEGHALIAIVIDDVGVKPYLSERVVNELPSEVTLSFLPYGEATPSLAPLAREKRHEVMIHLPMEAMAPAEGKIPDPGENALYANEPLMEIRQKTQENLAGLMDLSVGVNNHMGSRFTAWEEGMKSVLEVVADKGLIFLDSLTTRKSKVRAAAKSVNLPLLSRNVFLDHTKTEQDIYASFEKLERLAHKNGSAIGIGHPFPETISSFKKWQKTLEEKKIQLVPITTLLNRASS